MRITEIFKKQEHTFSFEFFPPRDLISGVEFGINVGRLMKLNPSFVTVTYGAGGSTQDTTFNLVDMFQNKLGITCMAHYTCVNATKEKVKEDLEMLSSKNISNLMLLRGDPPKGQVSEDVFTGDFRFASDLISFARSMNLFGIGAAAYPERHVEAKTLDADIQHTKVKVDAGADFLITQMFFKNDFYFNYVKKLRDISVQCRVIPGIIPVTNYKQIKKFAELSNATIPEEIIDAMEPYQDNEEKMYQIGLDLAIEQCRDLLAFGAPGIHFYTLNKSRAVVEIYEELLRVKSDSGCF